MMKSLLLIVALSTPAIAVTQVKVFGNWLVLSDGNHLTATSLPVNTSSRALFFRCDINHQNCVLTYTEAKPCNPKNFRFIHLSALADNVAENLKSQCIDGQWVKEPFIWDDMAPILYHSQKQFSVDFPDDASSTNIYSNNGAAAALEYILGINNNFNRQ